MEEIESKLKRKNTVMIANAISKLVDIIRTKSDSSAMGLQELSELKLLKKKCEDEDALVSLAACQGIVTLVELGVIQVASALSGFIAALTSTRSYKGIVNSVASLLVIDMNARILDKKAYVCPFAIQNPQHPMVTLLKQNKDIWLDICNQIHLLLHNNDDHVSDNSLELLRPLFLYILCDPSSPTNTSAFYKTQVWDLLLSFIKKQEIKLFMIDTLSWMQIRKHSEPLYTSQLYKTILKVVESEEKDMASALSIGLASLIHHLVSNGYDPSATLKDLIKYSSQESSSCIIMLLAETITICPSTYLCDIIVTCRVLVEMKSCNVIAAKMLTCSILQWLLYPSQLVAEALQVANETLLLISKNHVWGQHTIRILSNKWFNYIVLFDSRVHVAAQLCRLAESWQTNNSAVISWIQRVSLAPFAFTSQLHLFISAIFIHDFVPTTIRWEAWEVLHKMVEKSNELASNHLAYILYKLGLEIQPEEQLEFLKRLPTLAVLKENIPLIICTLELIKNKQVLRSIVIDLYTKLWKVEPRCFPYLQKVLQEAGQEDNWELNIAISNSAKQICELRPSQHGVDQVATLSNILNKCHNVQGSLAASLAIDAINTLCAADCLDISSAWKILAQKLSKDQRTAVNVSLCKLFGTVPIQCPPDPTGEKVIAEALGKLWWYVATCKNVPVIKAALKSLSKFNLKQMTLKMIPECYRQNLVIPKSLIKTPVDAAKKPEEILTYIPSNCWVQLLQNIDPDALEEAGLMLQKWINSELFLLRGVHYLPAGQEEPFSYKSLPPDYVCNGIVTFLCTCAETESDLSDNDKLIITECLRILSYTYSKILPPLNWTFLSKFMPHGNNMRKGALSITAKQSATSPSARKFIENFIHKMQFNLESKHDIEALFENLPDVCKGIPPNSTNRLVEQSLLFGVKQALEDQGNVEDLKFIQNLLAKAKLTLQKEYILDDNRTVIALAIESLVEKVDIDNPVFHGLLECIVELPTKFIERLSAPSNWWEVTEEKLRLSVCIRSAMAKRHDTDVPLVWLNECINATASLSGEHTTVLKNVAKVMASCWNHESNSTWLLDLMGQIQNVVNNNKASENQQTIVLLCDVFIITVIVISGNDCLAPSLESVAIDREKRLQYFPNALLSLLAQNEWAHLLPQVMEWMLFLFNHCTISPLYSVAFRQAFISLRHSEYFKELSVWCRFVNTRVN